MNVKHAAMLGFMGRQFDRFHQYTPPKSLAERLEMVKRVDGVSGIEIVYPNDFANPAETIRMVGEAGLRVAAVNLNVKGDDKWRYGSFTATDPRIRADAVADVKTCFDLAAEFGTDLVTCCPLIDGHNYSFEVDYQKQWEWLVEGMRAAVSYRPGMRLSLEYKPKEARNYVILSDIGRTLYLCQQVGLPHLGVTVDIGHSLLAGESPAEAVCLAAQAGRLFYVHFNDNGRDWDWDMLPASVNLWDMLETLYYLDRLGWEGWFSYDVMTRAGDPVSTIQATINIMRSGEKLYSRLGRTKLDEFVASGRPAEAFEYLVGSLA